MSVSFDAAFAKTIGHEGGYVNDPYDPGGETKYGISKRSYPHVNIKTLTLEQAKAIYKMDYWDRLSLDGIPSAVAGKIFDIGVNAGVGVASRIAGELETWLGELECVEERRALSLLRMLQAEHYIKVIRRNPTLVRYANGWSKRACSA